MRDNHPSDAAGGTTPDKVNKDVTPKADSAGESGGGAYPNPHSGKDSDGFDGGQTGKAYSGPDNPNATTE